MIRIAFFSLVILLAGCTGTPNSHKAEQAEGWTPPPAGTLVAADSMTVTEDQLNNAYFAVQLRVSEGNTYRHSDAFRYDLHATWGKAVKDFQIIMPFRGEKLKPLFRRGEGYSYYMGFIPGPEHGGDTSFHEYYRIDGGSEYMHVVPMKGFRIEE